ncbi:MAG: glycosyltransferase, partial [Ignavibacteria bacterium]|nr:glycosyltransferase [Ignavibacteria bacterium]
WYPENICSRKKGLKKFLTFIAGSFLNFIATNVSSYLIIGEKSKLKRYKFFSPLKPYSIISYYPILEFYPLLKPTINEKEIRFGYAGVISFSRGLKIISDALIKLKQMKNNLDIHLTICGRFEDESEKEYLQILEEKNIQVNYYNWVEYPDFPKLLVNTDICFDLRVPNRIYERSLPIRIFDYMALGKCIIASNFQPIKEIVEPNECGVIVNPLSIEEIHNAILSLIDDPKKIIYYGNNGRKAVEIFYNWSVCENELLKVYNQISFK